MATYRPAFTPWIATTRRPTGIRLKRAAEGREKQRLQRHHPVWSLLLSAPGPDHPIPDSCKRYWTRIKTPASSYRKSLQPWGQCWKQILKSIEFGCLPEALTHPSVCLITVFAVPRAHTCTQASASHWPPVGQLSCGNCTCTQLCPWQTQQHNLV